MFCDLPPQGLQHGHYTCLGKKSNLWLRRNDLNTNNERWPRGGKDVYIIILEMRN